MKKPKGIDPAESRAVVKQPHAALVCTHEDDERCAKALLGRRPAGRPRPASSRM